ILNRAVYEPVKALYPTAHVSNYGSVIATADKTDNVMLDLNGHLYTNSELFGNCLAPVLYGYRGLENASLKDGTKLGVSPTKILKFQLYNARVCCRAPGDFPVTPWVSHRSWRGDSLYKYQNPNDYYQEFIYHLGLMGIEEIILWNPAPWMPKQKFDDWTRNEADDFAMDSALRVLNRRLAGQRPRLLTSGPIAWQDELVVTGAQVGPDRVLWRVTRPDWGLTVKAMPKGTIIPPNKFIGFWFESKPGEKVSFEVVK
ncbi:MAG: hypothetical protein JW808_04235, partial [Victivallales bacterium]|nr:hypothetical protein [Victivallales bacterium]